MGEWALGQEQERRPGDGPGQGIRNRVQIFFLAILQSERVSIQAAQVKVGSTYLVAQCGQPMYAGSPRIHSPSTKVMRPLATDVFQILES